MIDTATIRIHRFSGRDLSVVGATHVGVVRESNEDRFAVSPANRMVAVADGMGGHERGEEAARLAVEAAVAVDAPDDETAVRAAIMAAQGAVARIVAEHGSRSEAPGCTLVVVRVARGGRHAIIGWLGDSRAYLVHRGAIRRITSDHATPMGSLTRCVGGGCGPDPGETTTVDLPRGAQILVCTDGLHGFVPDQTMAAVISAADSRASAIRSLLVEAETGRRGARASNDNITAVFVRGS